MTIAAAYLTSEGVVLGADSTTTVSVSSGGQSGVVQLFNHAQKVFEVGATGRLAICTWGMGSINGTSHRSLAARLGDLVDAKSLNVSDAADEFAAIVSAELAKGPPDVLGYFIGGWTPVTREPQCFKLTWDQAGGLKKDTMTVGMASFAGNPEYFARIFRGFSPSLPQLLLDAIRAKMPDLSADFDVAYEKALNEITPVLAVAGATDIPIREAIDYVHSYLHITIKAFKFKFGPAVCGGPIEIGFITTDRPFRWACHKGFGTATYEQEAH
jgi:hypothetical protein